MSTIVSNIRLVFILAIHRDYDCLMDYIENIARTFTKKYPCYLIHKKSEDKIKAFLTDRVKSKVNAARKSKVDDNTARMQSIKQLGV